MASRTILLTLALIALSSEYVVTYRIFDLDGVLIPQAPHPIVPRGGLRSQSWCLVNSKWMECPVISGDGSTNMRRSSHTKEINEAGFRNNMFDGNTQGFNRYVQQPINLAPLYVHPPDPKVSNLDYLMARNKLLRNELTNPLLVNNAPILISPLNQNLLLNLFPPFRDYKIRNDFYVKRRLNQIEDNLPSTQIKSNEMLGTIESTPSNKAKEHFFEIVTNINTDNNEAGPFPSPTNTVPVTNAINLIHKLNTESPLTTFENSKPTFKEELQNSSDYYITPSIIASETNPIDIVHNKLDAVTPSYNVGFGHENLNIRPNGTLTIYQNLFAEKRKKDLLDMFSVMLDKLDRKFYSTTFNKLMSICPLDRRENGISFVQSGLFLSLLLMALSTETDDETRAEIDQCLNLNITNKEKLEVVKHVLAALPPASDDFKFRWATRLVLGASQDVSKRFSCGAASALRMYVGKVRGNETDEELARNLNRMVEEDSGGAIRDTFEPEEVSGGVRAAALSTLYLRAHWRAAHTVLNGTRPFHDADGAPRRSTRMIRVNDVMRYASLDDCHFQALEISYATPGLSLLMLIPHGVLLRPLAQHLAGTELNAITRRLETLRVAATMPMYTLRMTLLLPSKLQAMGINKLISTNSNATNSEKLKLSHAVQRLMFWSEAGRNAFKDDGIEWDEAPELELVVDRPYLFFVRWHNITLMSGNFVL